MIERSTVVADSDMPAPVSLEFDDIVYSLQPFGGISEYWLEMTGRVELIPGFAVHHRTGTHWGRMRVQHSEHRVFHSSYYRTARGPKTRTVSTVHDLAYELGHVGTGPKVRLHCLEHKRAFFSSDALICISNSTREDLLQVYPTLIRRCEIFVVPHGVTLTRDALDGAGSEHLLGMTSYVLFVGGRGAYKNFDGALHAFSESRLARQGFVMACTGSPLNSGELQQVSRLGLRGAVYSVGTVSRSELARLYTGAYCLLYPSLFEGFGLPILEAMQLGCPVIASKRSAMLEVAGDAALLVDTRDPAAVAAALLGVGDTETRRRLIALGIARAREFSWDRSAAKHAAIYRTLS